MLRSGTPKRRLAQAPLHRRYILHLVLDECVYFHYRYGECEQQAIRLARHAAAAHDGQTAFADRQADAALGFELGIDVEQRGGQRGDGGGEIEVGRVDADVALQANAEEASTRLVDSKKYFPPMVMLPPLPVMALAVTWAWLRTVNWESIRTLPPFRLPTWR